MANERTTDELHTSDDVISGAASSALREAARRLHAELDAPSPDREIDAIRARECLHILVAILEGQRDLPDFSAFNLPQLLLFARVLQGLQSDLISRGGHGPHAADADELLGLLRRVERVRQSLHERTSEDSFVALLSSLRAPELLIELAHDFRSPLTSIIFLTETLRRGQSGPLNDLQHRQLGIIYGAALSLVSMAGDVIDLARGGNSLVEREPVPFSIRQSFEGVLDIVQPMIKEKEVALRSNTPEPDGRIGYPVALSRVLLNLTTNAVRFTNRGYVELAASDVGADRIEFSVTDTGSGIDPAATEHLFEPFRTVPSRDRIGFSGTGLGLSICQRLVAAMGGELRFETVQGAGTRFSFIVEFPASGG